MQAIRQSEWLGRQLEQRRLLSPSVCVKQFYERIPEQKFPRTSFIAIPKMGRENQS